MSAAASASPSVTLRRRATLAFVALVGLFGLYHLALQPFLSDVSAGLPFINSYGRQRMLSQRLLKAVLALQAPLPAEERQRLRAEASATLTEWIDQHEQLLRSDAVYVRSTAIGPALQDLDAHFRAMRAHGERFLQLVRTDGTAAGSPDERLLRELTLQLLAEEPLYLTRMHEVVALFQTEVQQRVSELRWGGWVIVALLLGVAAFLHAGIISPALRMTAEHLARERTRTLQDQLTRMQRLHTVGEMSSSLAHELGQPLSAIAAFAGACQQKLNSGDAAPSDLGALVDRIERSATRAGEVLQRFRAFGRNAPMSVAPLDMSTLLQEFRELCDPLLNEAGISLETAIQPAVPLVQGDALLLQQLLINLVQNSVHALRNVPAARKTIRIEVGADEQSGEVRIVVADAGHGIPPDVLPRLAEPFFTTRDTGLGLGLAICRTILEVHGGRMAISSVLGAGASVRVHLPAAPQETACV